MDRKEKLLLADKLHKEDRRDEALTILYELIAENEDDYFAWWGIANVSDDLSERLAAVGRVMQQAPSFQKAYALREELEALVPLDDPALDDAIDMFDVEDESDDTLLLADVDDDAFAEFQAQLAEYANLPDDPDVTAEAIASAFDDLDFAPPPVDLSQEELDGIEEMGFNDALDVILGDQPAPLGEGDDFGYDPTFDLPDRDDHTPYLSLDDHESADPQPDDFDRFDPLDDLGPSALMVDDPTNTLPDLSDIVGQVSEYIEDASWMDEFAPRTLAARLEDDVTGWDAFLPAAPTSNVFDDATPDFDDLLDLDPLAQAAGDSEFGDLLEDISLDSVNIPEDDTISFYGDGDIDRSKLAEAAAAMQAKDTYLDDMPDDMPEPDFGTFDFDDLDLGEAAPQPHISELDTDEVVPDLPLFDPMATALGWQADDPTPSPDDQPAYDAMATSLDWAADTPPETFAPHLRSVEGDDLNPQDQMLDLEIEHIARMDAALEDELASMQDALAMLQDMEAQLEMIVQQSNTPDEAEIAIDAALAEDLFHAEAHLDAALNFGDDPYPFDGLHGQELNDVVRQATDEAFADLDINDVEDDPLDRWAHEGMDYPSALPASHETIEFEELQAIPYDEDWDSDDDQLDVVLDADEQAALLADWNINLNRPYIPQKAASEPLDFAMPPTDTATDQPSHIVHEEDLIVRVSSGYEAPTFTPLPRPDTEDFDMNEAHVRDGEIVNEAQRGDLVVVPPPLHPPTPLNEFVQKNKAVIGVAIGVMVVRIAWRMLAGKGR